MAEISKTPKKGLSLPEHYDPSVDKLRENMALIDFLLQQANPNDLSSINDGESSINTLTTTGRYLVSSNATDSPIYGYAGIVDVFRAGTYILQEWRSINTYSFEFRRYSANSGSSWSGWIRDWNANNDGSGSGLDADMLDGIHGSSIYRKDYTSTDFNSAVSEGKYRIYSGTNAPHPGCVDWICVVYHLSGGTSELYQIAMEECSIAPTSITGGSTISYGSDVPMVFVRRRHKGTWCSWQCLWHSGNDGSGSGLNADLLDGYHSGNLPYLHASISTSGSYNIDAYYTEGFYSFADITSSKTLPTWSVNGAGYGLIVKDARGNGGFNCCHQLLFRDGNDEIYIRQYHSHVWSDWVQIGGTANDIITKLKTVDGSGSGLDADLLDNVQGSGYVRNFGITHNAGNDFNAIERTGFYQIDSAKNSPDGTSTLWGCIAFQTAGDTLGSNYLCQIAIKNSTDGKQLYTRKKNGTSWTAWEKIWTSGTDGSGSGLNADKLDDKHASDFVSCVKSTSSTDIDSVRTEGMYEYTSVTSTEGLPSFTGDGAAYGLIVKSVTGNSPFNCCFQILLKDGCSYVYMRYYHGIMWSSWEKLNPSASELLTKIKTVDGSGSGLDADTLDGKDSSYFSPLNEISITNMSELDALIAPQYKTEIYRVYGFFKADDELWSALPHSYNGFLFITSTSRLHDNLDDYHDYYVQTLINYSGETLTRVKSVDKLEIFGNVAWGDWNTSTTTANLLSQIQKIDGAGTGIDADLLDGNHASAFAQTNRTAYTDFNSVPLVVGMYGANGDATNAPVSSTGTYTVIVTRTPNGHMMLAINTVDNKIYRRHTTGAWSASTPWVTIGGTGLQQATVTCVDSSNAESTTSYYLRVSRADTSTALKSGDVLSVTMTNSSTYSGSLCYVRYVDSTTSVSKYLYNANGSSQVPISQLPKYFLMRYDGTNFEILTPLNQTVTISTSDPTSETSGKYGDVWYTY